jgi:hypothetical protein
MLFKFRFKFAKYSRIPSGPQPNLGLFFGFVVCGWVTLPSLTISKGVDFFKKMTSLV